MKKLQILALSMLFSTGMMVQASTIAPTSQIAPNMRMKITANNGPLQQKIAGSQQAAIFQPKSQADKKIALAQKFPTQAAAISNFQSLTNQTDKKNALQAAYQNRSAAGTNVFTGNTVNRALTAMSTSGSTTGSTTGSTSGSTSGSTDTSSTSSSSTDSGTTSGM